MLHRQHETPRSSVPRTSQRSDRVKQRFDLIQSTAADGNVRLISQPAVSTSTRYSCKALSWCSLSASPLTNAVSSSILSDVRNRLLLRNHPCNGSHSGRASRSISIYASR